VAFTARSAGTKSAYSSGETFWVPASAEPANALEQLAQEIFFFHASAVRGYDKEKSGAEWWSLVLDPQDAEVGFHWDKDYAVEYQRFPAYIHSDLFDQQRRPYPNR